jgi:hypothetical protein
MKATKVVGNQRQNIDVDVRTPAAFARAITTQNATSTCVSTINTNAEHVLLMKTLTSCVRPYAVAIARQRQENT